MRASFKTMATLVVAITFSFGSINLDSSVSAQDAQSSENSEAQEKDSSPESLWEAAKSGDLAAVKSAIESGVDVNAQTDYGRTALMYASDRGHLEIVKFLLESKADANLKDTFYKSDAISWATMNERYEVIGALLAAGASGADRKLSQAMTSGNVAFAKAVIDSKACSERALKKAFTTATKQKNEELLALFEGMEFKVEESPKMTLTDEQIKAYVGQYQTEINGNKMTAEITAVGQQLSLSFMGGNPTELEPTEKNKFSMGPATITASWENDAVVELEFAMDPQKFTLKPVTKDAKSEPKKEMPAGDVEKEKADATDKEFITSKYEPSEADLAVSSANWSSFRGNGARGVADGQNPPTIWNAEEKKNVLWRQPIPGLGLSCPSVFGDHIYLTSAVNPDANNDLKIGLYGNVESVEEDVVYEFRVFCVNKKTGEIVWNKMMHSAKPAVKRHAKSSHANPTVATDGKHVIAFFGSEGLYCLDTEGNEIWKKDFGVLDSGWFYDAGYQWGFGSSPVIDDGKVYVQCDIQKGSFVAAFNIENGEQIWRKDREEIPSWSSPTIVEHDGKKILVTAATKAARAYDANDGTLIWELAKHSEIVVPTPFKAHGLVYLVSGYSPIQPIYAVRPNAEGDISLNGDELESSEVVWSTKRGGSYMPSPIVYGDYMYVCQNSGVLTCYDAMSGKQIYKKRMKAPGGTLSFTASPLAGDGHLYFPAEDGRTLVVAAGDKFKQVAVNEVGESVLATPAISDGVMFIRTGQSLIAVGAKK